MTGKNIDITALNAALDAIEELNQTMTDENGHRWDRSDLIGQEIRAMRGIIGGAAESPRVIKGFDPNMERYKLGWPQAECLIVSVQAYDRAAQLAGQTLAKWIDEADGQPLSQECCEKLAHVIRGLVVEPARSILLAASQPTPDCHQPDLVTAARVKPLVWSDDPSSALDCAWIDDFGLYQITDEDVLFVGHNHVGRQYPTIADAKAAAQADYEARILAAIDVQPITAQEAARVPEVAALIEAAKKVHNSYWDSSDGVITGMCDLDKALRAIAGGDA